jgi:protein SCO1/2
MRLAWRSGLWLVMIVVFAVGCQSNNGSTRNDGPVVPGELKTFSIRGKIMSVNAAKGIVLLNHEAVPGFMEAMTMSYKLKDAGIISELHPGDRITAKLIVHKTSNGYEDPQLDEIVVTGQAKPDYKPTVQYHVPTAGDVVPDFKLLNQDGHAIHIGQFKGRVVLLTFIFTRCQLADFCPRMNKNFAEIDRVLAANPAMYKGTHLLSISFDPKFDTPEILKSYGGIYTGGGKETFAHWDFAAPPEHELGAMEQFFDVGVTPGDAGSLTHSMSTALIGKDGKVRAWYPTNEWTVDEVLAAMKNAAAA